MGDAKRKEELDKQLAAATQTIALNPVQTFVVVTLDLASHCVAGFAHTLGVNFQQTEPAAELQKTIDHLQRYKARFISEAGKKVLLAPASAMPPTPRG